MATCAACQRPITGAVCPHCQHITVTRSVPVAPSAPGDGMTELERFAAENNLKHPKQPVDKSKVMAGAVVVAAGLSIAAVMVLGAKVNQEGTAETIETIDKGTHISMDSDAHNVAILEEQYIAESGDPQGFPVAQTAPGAPVVVGDQTFHPNSANAVQVTTSAQGYCVVVTSADGLPPVRYDSVSRGTSAETPGVCG